MDQELSFRSAERNDVSKIFFFIRKMAEYEKLTSEVKADEKSLEEWIFDKKACEVLFLVLERRTISGRYLYPSGISASRIWQKDVPQAGKPRQRKRLRKDGVDVPGLE